MTFPDIVSPPPGDALGEPVDLGALMLGEDRPTDQPTILARDDGACLLYAGAVNGVHGEPGSGKSWLALLAARQVAERGGYVLYIDVESTADAQVERLVDLHVSPEVASRIVYVPTSGRLGEHGADWLERQIRDIPVDLLIVDSFGEMLAPLGDSNNDTIVASFVASALRPAARAGACVLVVDHVSKAAEQRGRWAIGSQRKLAAIDGAAIAVEISNPWARDRSGGAALTLAKDRRGWLGAAGSTVANLEVGVGDAGVRLDLVAPADDPDAGRPGGVEAQTVLRKIVEDGESWASITDAGVALGVGMGQTRRMLGVAERAGFIQKAPNGHATTYKVTETGRLEMRYSGEEGLQ